MVISTFDSGAPIPGAWAYTVLVPMPGSVNAASARGTANAVNIDRCVLMIDLLCLDAWTVFDEEQGLLSFFIASPHSLPLTSFLLLRGVSRLIPRIDAP